MELYEQIAKRKSTRKYLMDPLPKDLLSQIMSFTETLRPLISGIRTEIQLAGAESVGSMFAVKAPHYLLIFSEPKEGYRENAGFLLQQVDLYLSSLGLGSCWLGMAKSKLESPNGTEYVIMLGFGAASGSPHRTSLSDFTRKTLSEIAEGDDLRFEAARLAPSAGNTQPWFYRKTGDGIEVYRTKFGALKNAMYGVMNQIDIGIGLCHMWLAGEHFGQPLVFTFGGRPSKDVPQGYTFVGQIS